MVSTMLHNIILYQYAIENTVANSVNGAYVQCMMSRLDVIIEFTSAFLYPDHDWLYFLWHGINDSLVSNQDSCPVS